MIVDTSAIIAMLRPEADATYFAEKLLSTSGPHLLSAGNYLEAAIVADGNRDPLLSHGLDELLETSGVAIEPVTAEQARLARQAYRDYGKGSGHPARLNYGDCFAYALAKATGHPLLYKGRDFSQTDIAAA